MERPNRILAAGLTDAEGRLLLTRLEHWAGTLECIPQAESALARLTARDYDLLVAAVDAESLRELARRAARVASDTLVIAVAREVECGAVCLERSGVTGLIGPLRADSEGIDTSFSRIEQIWRASREAPPASSDPETPMPGTSASRAPARDPFAEIIGSSPAIRGAVDVLRLIAPRRSTVLIEGPTGSGKELAARALHKASPRAAGPFVTVNCAAIPENLFESELFGHVKGAFTGASSTKPGRFEQADGGTLFLDEVGELPLEMQPKLLRALQEREVRRIGAPDPVPVDVRIIAATNRSLEKMVAAGSFREDLFYRLAVVPAPLPPLAERREDIPAIAAHLLARFCDREDLPGKQIADDAVRRLMEYPWPGNVRQLENAVEKAAALSGERRRLEQNDFPLPLQPAAALHINGDGAPKLSAAGIDYGQAVAHFERSLLEQALEITGGNKKQAADLLRMKRTTLNARWKALVG